jgi:hypothetical protein
MRTRLSLVSPLAAAALYVGAVLPAAAQQAHTPDQPVPVVRHVSALHDPGVRTLAVYRLAAAGDANVPARITVADSAGRLVASYQLRNSRVTTPMDIEVLNRDIMLQGETPAGLLTLQLYRLNDSEAASPVAGRWWIGDQQGALRGRVVR